MTVGEWLHTRMPRPPLELAARLDAVIGEGLNAPASSTPDVLLSNGERLVAELLGSNSTSRESALDLLAADALVTYAFEAEAHSPTMIEARAASAMMRISSIDVGRA
ncbi:MAG: hypothetical protein JWM95_3349 [Gemmatimonadetes bacterium]|nr:hypothetical protein [Gemmatimonadota bacterium]